MAVAQKLAVTLGETEEKPILQLARAVDVLTAEKAEAYAKEAVEVAAGKGIMKKDGSGKRSPGGTFFALVREREAKDHKVWRKIKPVMKQKTDHPTSLAEQMPALIEMTTHLKAGPLAGSKTIIIGRPDTIQKQAQFVAFTIKDQHAPALPKGLPIFQGKTKYLVLAATKQWEKVEKKITDDKEDQLYIEGFSTAQTNFKSGIVLLAMNVNTIGLMRQKRK
jgi:Phosphorylated adapter RNA export protein, RNA-binding domain